MAQIVKRQQRRADGSKGPVRWRARYHGPDGLERSSTFTRRVDAERWWATQQADVARGAWVDPALGRISFADWSASGRPGCTVCDRPRWRSTSA